MMMRKRLIAILVLWLILALVYLPSVHAHGERAQEAFLRMQTVAFFDVKYSENIENPLKQGEEWSVTGTMKILETWPETLGEPTVGYIGLTTQGPSSLMMKRVVNGKDTPHSINIKRGDVFNFEMSFQARRPGRWHVHPIIGVEGMGSVMGPGVWVNIEDSGGFEFPLKLMNGQTVDVENYGFSFVFTLNVVGFLLGLWYMWHWTGPRPTVTRLAVNLQIGLHDTGEDFGLIEKRDHTWMNIFAILTLILLAVGWFYATSKYPGDIPLQVIRFTPPKAPEDPNFVQVKTEEQSIYDVEKVSMIIPVEVTNTGTSNMSLTHFNASTLVFSTTGEGAPLVVEPAESIAPGETKKIKITLTDDVWEQERLVPIGEAQMLTTGVLTFHNDEGQKNRITVQMPMRPTQFHGYRGAIYY